MQEKLSRLKIIYVFSEERHPNKDFKVLVSKIIDNLFVPWVEQNFSKEQENPFGVSSKKSKSEFIDEKIEKFLGSDQVLDLLRKESEMLQKLFFHPKSIELFKKRSKKLIQS